jgi:hypothetical protein
LTQKHFNFNLVEICLLFSSSLSEPVGDAAASTPTVHTMAAVLFAVVVDIVIVAAMVDVGDAVLTRTSTTPCLAGNKQQPPIRACPYRDATVHRRPSPAVSRLPTLTPPEEQPHRPLVIRIRIRHPGTNKEGIRVIPDMNVPASMTTWSTTPTSRTFFPCLSRRRSGTF